MVNMSKKLLIQACQEVGGSSAFGNALWGRIQERIKNKVPGAKSAYNLCAADLRKKHKNITMKEIAQKWNKLDEKKKKTYMKKAAKDKERYIKDKTIHEQKMLDTLSPRVQGKIKLKQMTCKELRIMCKGYDLSATGNKDTLVETILNHSDGYYNENESGKESGSESGSESGKESGSESGKEDGSESENVLKLTKMTVAQLRTLCKEQGLKTSGKKSALIENLRYPLKKKTTHPAPIITVFSEATLKKLKVAELRTLCKEKNIKTTKMKKQDLIKALCAFEDKEGEEEEVEEGEEVEEEEVEEEEVEEGDEVEEGE